MPSQMYSCLLTNLLGHWKITRYLRLYMTISLKRSEPNVSIVLYEERGKILTCGWILPFSVTYQCLVAEISSITASTVTILQDTLRRVIFRDITPHDVPRASSSLREWPEAVEHGSREHVRFCTGCAARNETRAKRNFAYCVAYFLAEWFETYATTTRRQWLSTTVAVADSGRQSANVKLPVIDTNVMIKTLSLDFIVF